MLTVPHGLALFVDPALGWIFSPHPASASTATPTAATTLIVVLT
jgi:hypothetical protein